MARKNYSKFSKKSEDVENVEEVVEEVVKESNESMNEVFNEIMDEIVEEKTVEEVIGVVGGCTKLNVRKEAKKDATVLCIIDKGTEVVIDQNDTSERFYKVCTSSGVTGYCMKEFIKVK